MIYLAIVLPWFICSLASHGLLYAFFRQVAKEGWATRPSVQRTAQEVESADFRGALVMSAFGPITLFVALPMSEWGKTGFRLWRESV